MSAAKRPRSASPAVTPSPNTRRAVPGSFEWFRLQALQRDIDQGVVFTPGQVHSLFQTATDLAKGLSSRYSRSRQDKVVFLGDSPGWLYIAFRALGYHNQFSSVHLPLSGYPYEEGKYEDRIEEKHLRLYTDKAVKPLFPSGLHGTVWLVDNTNDGASVKGAIRLLHEINALRGYSKNSYDIKFVLLRSPAASPSKRIPCQAFSIVLRDPPEDAGNKHDVMYLITANGSIRGKRIPRASAMFGLEQWPQDLQAIWMETKNDILYKEAVKNINAGLISWEDHKKRSAFGLIRRALAIAQRFNTRQTSRHASLEPKLPVRPAQGKK